VVKTFGTDLKVALIPIADDETPVLATTKDWKFAPSVASALDAAQHAREAGADIVIAVDISARAEGQPVDSLTAIIWQTTTIMGGVIGAAELRSADIAIRPRMPHVTSSDCAARNDAMLEGERAAQAALPAIKQKLGR